MILDEIVLHNFGVFRGEQRATLTPPSPKKPIVLFGGLNGAGKTTLLDALHLCLYGQHGQGRGNGTYETYLRRSIHHAVPHSEGAGVQVSFRSFVDGQERRITVFRSWQERRQKIREHLDVFVDDQRSKVHSETWSEQVERFLPSRLSQLFFFDGERIESFADTEQTKVMLSTALHALLGMDLVDRLKTDLVVLRRRKQKETKQAPQLRAIDELEEHLKALDERLEELRERRAAQSGEVARLESSVQKLEKEFSDAGGTLAAKRSDLDKKKAAADEKHRSAQQQLVHAAEGALPLLLVPELLEHARDQAKSEVQADRSLLLSDAFRKRDRRLLTHLRDVVAAREAIPIVEAFLAQEVTSESQRPPYLHMGERGSASLDLLVSSVLPEQTELTERLLQAARDASQEVDDLDQLLAAAPDDEAVAEHASKLDRERATLATGHRTVAMIEQEIGTEEQARQRIVTNLESLYKARSDSELAAQDSERFVTHTSKVGEALDRFRGTMIRRHTARLESLILESYRQLLRKESLVAEISIDPDSYELELRGASTERIRPERLSAGERQLLAVSILWALGRASGRPLPAVVDTPLGRLDATHRHHLVTRYFPFASHQVLLLSTDEEIDEKLLASLRRWIGHSYHLVYDDATESSRIEEGYFW